MEKAINVFNIDLNGKNISAVYSNDKISYTYRLTVVDGVVYSWFSEIYQYQLQVNCCSVDLSRVIKP